MKFPHRRTQAGGDHVIAVITKYQSITRRDSDFEILRISRHNPAFSKISLRYVKILNNIIIFGICRSNENGKRY